MTAGAKNKNKAIPQYNKQIINGKTQIQLNLQFLLVISIDITLA